MEKLTTDQQQRRERATEIRLGVESGTITDVGELDPRETSSEFVAEMTRLMRAMGRAAERKIQSGL